MRKIRKIGRQPKETLRRPPPRKGKDRPDWRRLLALAREDLGQDGVMVGSHE